MSNGADTTADLARPPATPGQSGLLPLAAVTFVALLGFGVFIPVFPYYGRALGASDAAVTLSMAAYSLGQFASAPFWGRLSDRYGRKPILVGSTLLAGFAYILVAHSTSIEMLFTARLLGGLMAGNIAAAFAAASDISTPQTRAKAMGILGASFGLGFIVGPAIGGEIAGAHPTLHSMANVAYASAAMNVLAALATLFVFRETLKPGARSAERRTPRLNVLKKRPRLQVLTIVSLLATTAGGLMEASMGFLAADRFNWSPRDLGHLFALVGILSVVMQGGAIGGLTKRFGESKLLLGGLVTTAIGLAAAGFAMHPAHAYLACVFLAIGSAVTNPTLTTLASYEAAEHERGGVLGVVQSASSLGRVAGPAGAGFLYAALGGASPFLLGAVISLFCAMLVWRILRKTDSAQRI